MPFSDTLRSLTWKGEGWGCGEGPGREQRRSGTLLPDGGKDSSAAPRTSQGIFQKRPAPPVLAAPSLRLPVLMDNGWSGPSPCLCRGPLQPRWASARALPGLPPAAPKVTSGHPRHPEHAPSGNIALGAGPSMASALGTHHPEMVTATKATPRGSQARRLQPVSPVPPSLPPFTPHGDLPWGSSPQT